MSEVVVTQADEGRTLHARAGDTVVVRLAEPATSGYRWEPSGAAGDGLQSSGDTNEPGADGVGAAAMRSMTFRATQPGTFTIALRLRRSWEAESSALQRFHATIVVS